MAKSCAPRRGSRPAHPEVWVRAAHCVKWLHFSRLGWLGTCRKAISLPHSARKLNNVCCHLVQVQSRMQPRAHRASGKRHSAHHAFSSCVSYRLLLGHYHKLTQFISHSLEVREVCKVPWAKFKVSAGCILSGNSRWKCTGPSGPHTSPRELRSLMPHCQQGFSEAGNLTSSWLM